jgi:hypothetical protein
MVKSAVGGEGPYVGRDALAHEPHLNLAYPFQGDGQFSDLDKIRLVWQHVLKTLEVPQPPHDWTIIIGLDTTVPFDRREKIAKEMLENFGFSQLFISTNASYYLMSIAEDTNSTTGLVLEFCDTRSQLSVVKNGIASPFASPGHPEKHGTLQTFSSNELAAYLVRQLDLLDVVVDVKDVSDKKMVRHILMDVILPREDGAAPPPPNMEFRNAQKKMFNLSKLRFPYLKAIFEEPIVWPTALNDTELQQVIMDFIDIMDAGTKQKMYRNVVAGSALSTLPMMIDGDFAKRL